MRMASSRWPHCACCFWHSRSWRRAGRVENRVDRSPVPAPGEPKVETISWDSEYGASFRAVSTGGSRAGRATHSQSSTTPMPSGFIRSWGTLRIREARVLDDRHHGVDRLRRHAIVKPGVR